MKKPTKAQLYARSEFLDRLMSALENFPQRQETMPFGVLALYDEYMHRYGPECNAPTPDPVE